MLIRIPPHLLPDGGATTSDAAPDLTTRPPDSRPTGQPCAPAPEVCNGKDDDCNDRVDDVPAIAVQNDIRQCGSCDVTCLPVPPNAESVCRSAKCEYTCKEGYQDVNKSKVDGCECQFTGREVCDGKDNDCNGMVDEEFNLMTDPNNCGSCGRRCNLAGVAQQSCGGGKCVVGMCSAGRTDRNKDPADGCESNCAETNMAMEICDGLDNDCDGAIDEYTTETNRTTDDKVVYLPAPLDVTIFMYEGSRPDATDKAPGTNSKVRPCSLPNKLPWANVTSTEAANACKAMGGRWRLCTRDEWVGACNKKGVFPYGATYDPKLCNGADYGATPPGPIATGTAMMCAADMNIMDMSGNVREWVQTSPSGNAFELRGGAYNVVSFDGDAPGLKCSGVVPAPTTDVRLPSVGFRCCYSGRLPQ